MVEKDLLGDRHGKRQGRREGVEGVARKRDPATVWRRAAALLVCAALLGACGPERGVQVRTEPPREASAEHEDGVDDAAADERAAAEERRVEAADPGAGTPRRQASHHLVEEGVRALDAGDVSGAARRLEEAIRVDGSNGLAYYHLARARIEAGRQDEALGLLDRAIELLRAYPERRREAERLRAQLSGGD